MKKYLFVVSIFIVLLFSLSVCARAKEEITITTYYPSPYGVYNELTTYSNTYLAVNGGNVGIGTTAPQQALVINRDKGTIWLYGGVGNHLFGDEIEESLVLSTPMVVNVEDGDAWRWRIARVGLENDYGSRFSIMRSVRNSVTDNEDFVINAKGNIGIGANNPLGKLCVDGNIGIGTNAPYGRLCVIGGRAGIGTNMPGSLLHVNGTSEFEDNINTNGNWISGDGGSEGISIDSIGNVGIGTIGPQSKLQVAGSFSLPIKVVTEGTYNLTDSDFTIIYEGGTSPATMYLPAPENARGRVYIIKDNRSDKSIVIREIGTKVNLWSTTNPGVVSFILQSTGSDWELLGGLN